MIPAVVAITSGGDTSEILPGGLIMQRLLKFCHTIGGIGLMGSMAALLILLAHVPDPTGGAPGDLAAYVRMTEAIAAVGNWLFFPSVMLTLLAGMASMAVNKVYQSIGWVWAKLATGFVMFEGSLVGIHGPIRREVGLAGQALADPGLAPQLGASVNMVWWTLWVLMFVAAVNVALGIWRPRFKRSVAREPSDAIG